MMKPRKTSFKTWHDTATWMAHAFVVWILIPLIVFFLIDMLFFA